MNIDKRVLVLTLLCAGVAQTAGAVDWDPKPLEDHYAMIKRMLNVNAHRTGNTKKIGKLNEMLDNRCKQLNTDVTGITKRLLNEPHFSSFRMTKMALTSDELLAIFKGLSDKICTLIQTIEVKENDFTYLPAAIFVRFKNVESIDISNCKNLTNLESSIFDKLNANLTHLLLNSNPNLSLTDSVMSSFYNKDYNKEKKYKKLELVNLPKACKDSDIEKAIKNAYPNIILQCF